MSESLHIFRLTRRFGLSPGGDPWHDSGGIRGMVIVAESEAHARQIASENGGKENQWLPKLHLPGEDPVSPWLNKHLTDCESLTMAESGRILCRVNEETDWDWD